EAHGRDRVQPVEGEVDPLRPGAAPLEVGRVNPVGAPDPGRPDLVVVQVRIRDEAGGEQVGVHAAGDGGGDPGNQRARGGLQRPALVQQPPPAHAPDITVIGVTYLADPNRYDSMVYRRCGRSGLLLRMGLDYVDIFYSHRFDPDTPLEETLGALDSAVRAGKALYAGISSYSPAKTAEAVAILRDLGTPLLIHQPSYSMFNRWIED